MAEFDLEKRKREEDSIRVVVENLRLRRETFLIPTSEKLPEECYWQEKEFQDLAQACGEGNSKAVEQMALFFVRKQEKEPKVCFYNYAANFWSFRSWSQGNEEAGDRLKHMLECTGGERLYSPYLTETLSGRALGRELNALGFLFFDEDRVYNLQGVDSFGVVTVFSFESEDAPDEDGFGRETYYDWWHLDGDLSPAPGTRCLHRYSGTDRNSRSVSDRFHENHMRVREQISRKQERMLDF